MIQAAREMEQLLQSISRVNMAREHSSRNFQSHIFFDNGICGTQLTEFALQLLCVAKETLGEYRLLCFSLHL